jgi:hypothetical protein
LDEVEPEPVAWDLLLERLLLRLAFESVRGSKGLGIVEGLGNEEVDRALRGGGWDDLREGGRDVREVLFINARAADGDIGNFASETSFMGCDTWGIMSRLNGGRGASGGI